VRRKNEDSIWMGWARNQGLDRMTNAGHVKGIQEVTQGLGLDVKPYGLVSAEAAPVAGSPSWDGDKNAGVDVFYNPTPGLRANVTVNTDFAQTEVDQRQVNLTRFSLFFPERRDFFLDGATFFDFASTSGNGIGSEQVQPFFSRNIGLSADLRPQRIDVGSKLTGQAGGQDIGFLHVRTGDEKEGVRRRGLPRRAREAADVPAVLRRRDLHEPSGAAPGAHTTRTAGFDFRLATSRFRGNQNLNLAGWFLHATQAERLDRRSAYGIALDYPNDRWFGGINAREVQRNFDPSVGFVTRRDYRRFNQFVGWGPRPNTRLVRRVQMNGGLEIFTDSTTTCSSATVGLTLMNLQLQSQDQVAVEASHNLERLDAPFPIAPGITLPMGGEYTFRRIAVAGQTANRRVLALNGRFETGEFYSGTRRQTIAGLTIRARPGYIFSLNGEWNDVDLAEGAFTSNVFRVVADSQFSPFMAVVNNIQYDTVSRVLGWQARYRWIMRPGNDLYLVYTHNWRDDVVTTDSPQSTGSSPLKCCIHTGSRHDPAGAGWGMLDQRFGQGDESGARCLFATTLIPVIAAITWCSANLLASVPVGGDANRGHLLHGPPEGGPHDELVNRRWAWRHPRRIHHSLNQLRQVLLRDVERAGHGRAERHLERNHHPAGLERVDDPAEASQRHRPIDVALRIARAVHRPQHARQHLGHVGLGPRGRRAIQRRQRHGGGVIVATQPDVHGQVHTVFRSPSCATRASAVCTGAWQAKSRHT
jgi:hypothetical protein